MPDKFLNVSGQREREESPHELTLVKSVRSSQGEDHNTQPLPQTPPFKTLMAGVDWMGKCLLLPLFVAVAGKSF